MKSFLEYMNEARGGDYVIVNKKTGVLMKRSNKKGDLPALYGTERDAWDVVDKLASHGKDYTVKKCADYHVESVPFGPQEAAEMAEEVKTADQIKREIVSKHAGHFSQEAQDYLHKSKTYGNRAISHLMDNHGIAPGYAKAAISKIKDDVESSLGSSKSSTNAERINRYLGQKHIGPIKRSK